MKEVAFLFLVVTCYNSYMKDSKLYYKKWRDSHKEIIKEYQKKFRALHPNYYKKYFKSPKFKERAKMYFQKRYLIIKNDPSLKKKYQYRVQKSVKLWRENNPGKVKAQRKIYVEIRSGRMKRGKCFCGNKGEAHHEDYRKPLEVTWLCKKHHIEADLKRRR